MKQKIIFIILIIFNSFILSSQNVYESYSNSEIWYASSDIGGELNIQIDILEKTDSQILFSIYKDFSRFPILKIDKISAYKNDDHYEFNFIDSWENEVYGTLTFSANTLLLFMKCTKTSSYGKNEAENYFYSAAHNKSCLTTGIYVLY